MAKVLVLGGVGFIGRNLVAYLLEKGVASYIRAVDKVLPATAFLGGAHAAAFENPIVEAKQCNLSSDAGIDKAFHLDEGNWDWVVNCAAETKYSQTQAVYQEKILDLAKKLATKAASLNVPKFIELSHAQVYASGKKPSKESDQLKPWTVMAEFKLAAENELKSIAGLNLVILRPAIVYGPGDTNGLSPRIITAAVYKQLDERMKLLWDGGLRINTVHVHDVCKAIVHACQNLPVGTTFNLADKSDLSQERLNAMLEEIFKIKTGFQGTVISNMAKLNMKLTTETINEKHLKPWADLCKADNISNTPLTPYLDTELLLNNALSVDGSAIEGTGFTYDLPNVTTQLIRDQIQYYVAQGLFPRTILPN